jgi:hypothetical protein
MARRARRRNVFLIIDRPCHNLDEAGKRWLAEHLAVSSCFACHLTRSS